MEGRKTISKLGSWIAKRVVGAQGTHFVALKETLNEHMFGWGIQLKELKQQLASDVSGPVLPTGHLKELLASLREGANLGGLFKAWLPDGIQMRSLGAKNPSGSEMRSLAADDSSADDPGIDNSEAGTSDGRN